jgi:hypothetical protein
MRGENEIPAASRHFGTVPIVWARGKEFACGELQIVISKHTLSVEPERFSARNSMRRLMPFEVLHFPLVFFRCFPSVECAQIFPFTLGGFLT